MSKTLKQEIADKKAQEPTLRRNPEIDAKLDKFIGENPKLLEYYNALSKDELVRKLMLGKLQRSEYTTGRNSEIKAWVEEHPDVNSHGSRSESATCLRPTGNARSLTPRKRRPRI